MQLRKDLQFIILEATTLLARVNLLAEADMSHRYLAFSFERVSPDGSSCRMAYKSRTQCADRNIILELASLAKNYSYSAIVLGKPVFEVFIGGLVAFANKIIGGF